MFICKECGQEYKEKPEFCDCGNDTFDCINTKPETKQKHTHNISVKNSEIISIFIFVVCLILSGLVLLFFPKITPQEKTPNEQKIVMELYSNIPELNSFWVDSKPEPEIIQQVEKIKEIFIQPKVEPKKTEVKTTKKPQTTVKQPTQKPQSAKPAAKPKDAKPAATQVKPQRTNIDYEMINYKSALRMQLLSNLKSGDIQGTGSCGIEFVVDSTGKLINRGFTFQSENETVNKAIYEMLMRTPRYNPPPSSYDGKKIKLNFKFNSSGYEISFVD